MLGARSRIPARTARTAVMACLVVAAAGTPGGQRGILENRAEAAPLFRPSTKVVLFTPAQPDPLDRLKVAVTLLFELSKPDPTARRPLFTDFAPQLLISHPTEVKVAHAPLVALFGELMEGAGAAGLDGHREFLRRIDRRHQGASDDLFLLAR